MANINEKTNEAFEMTDEIEHILDICHNTNKSIFITGRAGCVDSETEFLTPTGWKKISEYVYGDIVGEYDRETQTCIFNGNVEYIKEKSKDAFHVKTSHLDMVLTDEHTVLYRSEKNFEYADSMINIYNHILGLSASKHSHISILPHFDIKTSSCIDLTEHELRLMVAVIADGHFSKEANSWCRVNIKRKRKQERLRTLLRNANISWEEKNWNPRNPEYINFVFYAPRHDKVFNEYYWGCSKKQLEYIYDEFVFWDGGFDKRNGHKLFRTSIKESADFMQYCITTIGRKLVNIHVSNRIGYERGGYKIKSLLYTVRESSYTKTGFNSKHVSREKLKDGHKYCFTTSTGYWIARRNNKIFVTGNSSKSTTINKFINETTKNVAVLAPTGVAAINLGGQTLHSFFKFGIDIVPHKAKSKGQNERESRLYQSLKTIIIDEVSMVRSDLLDCVDKFLMAVKGNKLPFGGVQMIFVGDLFQLPPVIRNEDRKHLLQMYKSEYFFDSRAFMNPKFDFEIVELTKIFRQTDTDFIDFLNKLRDNTITQADLDFINKNVNPSFDNKDMKHIFLTTTNFAAKKVNDFYVSQLNTEQRSFRAKFGGIFNPNTYPCDQLLTLKIGTRVMLKCNRYGHGGAKNPMYNNGTMGTVVGFNDASVIVEIEQDGITKQVTVDENTWDNYRYFVNPENGRLEKESVGYFTQIPIKIAYAMTIHSVQGQTFDKAVIDMGNGSFAHGQTYVAFSRCSSLEGLVLKSKLKMGDVIMDEQVKDFFTRSRAQVSMDFAYEED